MVVWVRDEWSHSNQSVLMISSVDQDLDKQFSRVLRGSAPCRSYAFQPGASKYFPGRDHIQARGRSHQKDQLLTIKLFFSESCQISAVLKREFDILANALLVNQKTNAACLLYRYKGEHCVKNNVWFYGQ